MVVSASDPIGESASRTNATVWAPRALANRSAASVSSVRPEYEARTTIESESSRWGARQISSYERITSDGVEVRRSNRYLPEYIDAHEPPDPTKNT